MKTTRSSDSRFTLYLSNCVSVQIESADYHD